MTGYVERGDLGLAIESGRQREFKESLDMSVEYATVLNCNKYLEQLKSFMPSVPNIVIAEYT